MEKFRYVSKEKINEIPKTPGVYSFWDGKILLYIGKAANLRDRVRNHFQSAFAKASARQATFRDSLFIDQVTRIGYIETNSEIEALLLESQLIKQNLPKYNVMWKDGKQYFYVGMSKQECPRVFLTHQKERGGTYIGPFVDGKAIKRTLRSLRRVFPYYTAKKHPPRPCQYCNLGLCPGPPTGGLHKKEYRKNIKNLVAVLRAQKPAVLKKLQREMNLAAKNQEYEKAGRLRDQIQDLEIIFSHAKVFRTEEEKSPLNWPETEKYLQKVLKTKQRISRVEAYDISNIQGKEATGSMPVFIDGKPAKEHYRKFKIRLIHKKYWGIAERSAGTPRYNARQSQAVGSDPNDFAMLQEVITRRLAHPEWPYPDLMIIDGGKPQLSATLKAIEETIKQTMHKFHDREKSVRKIRSIRVAAIAKRRNELFLPGQSKPLLLKDMPQRVSNFILHMRDEAHRFAISYHRLLRKKKVIRNS